MNFVFSVFQNPSFASLRDAGLFVLTILNENKVKSDGKVTSLLHGGCKISRSQDPKISRM